MFEILNQVKPPSVENSQRTMLPVLPLSVIFPELAPVHLVAEPANVPATVGGSIAIEITAEVAEAHPPF